MAFRPSRAPTAENAQQEPHYPWSFTADTAPFFLQSIDIAWDSWPRMGRLDSEGIRLYPVLRFLNSSKVKSMNAFSERVKVDDFY